MRYIYFPNAFLTLHTTFASMFICLTSYVKSCISHFFRSCLTVAMQTAWGWPIMHHTVYTHRCFADTQLYLFNARRGFSQAHSSGDQALASLRAGPGSLAGQSMWDLWCTKQQWDRLLSESFVPPLSTTFHRCSILINSCISWGLDKGNSQRDSSAVT